MEVILIVLFYDIEKKCLERFEPHGSGYPSNFNYNPDLLDEIIKKKFLNIFSNHFETNIDIQYLRPKDYLPKIGFQTLDSTEADVNKNIGDPNGFCTLWTIWYLDHRIHYVDTNPKKLVIKLINKIRMNNKSFRAIIRNYSRK